MIEARQHSASAGAESLTDLWQILGHEGYGVSQLRALRQGLRPLVAYADSSDELVRLALEFDGRANVYVGANPCPLAFHDSAPGRWVPAGQRTGRQSEPGRGTCCTDSDVEFCTVIAFDIDRQVKANCPATGQELA